MSKKETVRSYYNQYASNYDRFYSPLQQEKFSQFQDHLRPYTLGIDLGGGSGLVSDWIDWPLLNLDISIEMIRSGHKSRDFQAVAADLEHLPLRKNATSQIISLTALQNTEDLDKALRELVRITTLNMTGIISLLKKGTDLTAVIQQFLAIGIQAQQVAYSGEDYLLSIHY